jgi:iron complex transport system substrate-binding protein
MIEAVPIMNTRRIARRPRTPLLVLLVILAPTATVRPQSTPQRIVSLVPAVTEMLFAMGAGGLVVGVSSFDAFPAGVRALPKVGALVDPDFERILSLRPNLVVVYGSQDELIGRLARAGIASYRYRHAGLADIGATMRELGARVGRANEAGRLAAGIDAEIDAVRQAVRQQRRPSTLLVVDREPGTLRGIYASAAVGFMHDMLLAAGGADTLQDVARENLQMSVELLLARAPEVIVEVYPSGGWTPDRIARERAVWAALPSLPAVRNGRIHILADDRLLIPGPRVGAAVRLLADTLHPTMRGR